MQIIRPLFALTALLIACDPPKPVEDKPVASEPAPAEVKPVEEVKPTEEAKPVEEVKPADGEQGAAAAPAAPTGSITPDAADTAKAAPKAEDLARYTSDLGKGKLIAVIQTSMGAFRCELFEDKAPLTVANFVGLARGLKAWTHPQTNEVQVGKPLYDGVLFHRVIPGFMLQAGDPLGQGFGGPGYQIPDEFGPGLMHDRGGLLSMANAGPNTGGSQFFITEVPTPHLNNRHAIFGQCDNLELVKKIAGVPRNRMDRPDQDVRIEKISIQRSDK